MEWKVIKTSLEEIRSFRTLFLQEGNFQFVCNKCHDYGWADTYLFLADNVPAGYGSVWGTDRREDRDTIFEFYLVKPYRKFSSVIFRELHAVCGAVYVECQTNDWLLTAMLYEFTRNIRAEAVLFEDHFETHYSSNDVIFRKKKDDDKIGDDDSDYVLERNGDIMGSGGLMLNYNHPYADIYMQINEPFRRLGLGTFLVQELKREAYHIGKVPAARCNINNAISKATLLKAGLRVCGFRVKGDLPL